MPRGSNFVFGWSNLWLWSNPKTMSLLSWSQSEPDDGNFRPIPQETKKKSPGLPEAGQHFKVHKAVMQVETTSYEEICCLE